MACYANAACINVRKTGNVLNAVIKTVCIIFVFPPCIRRDNLGVTVAVHADSEDNVSAASVLNIVKVLHLTVIIPTVAYYDSGSLGILCCRFGNEKKSVKLMTAVGVDCQVVVLYCAKIGLKYGSSERANDTEDQGKYNDELCF
jgi:hypothetical protein